MHMVSGSKSSKLTTPKENCGKLTLLTSAPLWTLFRSWIRPLLLVSHPKIVFFCKGASGKFLESLYFCLFSCEYLKTSESENWDLFEQSFCQSGGWRGWLWTRRISQPKLSPSLRPLSSPHRMLLIEFQSQPPSESSSSSKPICRSSTLKLAPSMIVISSANSVADFDQSSTWRATASSTGNVIGLYNFPAQRPTQGHMHWLHCSAHCIFTRYQFHTSSPHFKCICPPKVFVGTCENDILQQHT